MAFLDKNTKDTIELFNYYTHFFGRPTRILEGKWFGNNIKDIGKVEIFEPKKNSYYVLEFEPNEERPIWTYITLGMSSKKMVNEHSCELIWYCTDSNRDIFELMLGLIHYPFSFEISLGYGHTITNEEAVSAFLMNTLLVCPPIFESVDSEELLDIFEYQDKELLWLIPIHQEEKEFYLTQVGLNGIDKLFDIWRENNLMDVETLSNPLRELAI